MFWIPLYLMKNARILFIFSFEKLLQSKLLNLLSSSSPIMLGILKVFHLICIHFFFRSLVNPAHERRIVIVESLFNKAEVRQLIAKILFEESSFQIPSLLFVPAPLMAIFPYASSTGFVIDIGYHSTSVFPVHF